MRPAPRHRAPRRYAPRWSRTQELVNMASSGLQVSSTGLVISSDGIVVTDEATGDACCCAADCTSINVTVSGIHMCTCAEENPSEIFNDIGDINGTYTLTGSIVLGAGFWQTSTTNAQHVEGIDPCPDGTGSEDVLTDFKIQLWWNRAASGNVEVEIWSAGGSRSPFLFQKSQSGSNPCSTSATLTNSLTVCNPSSTAFTGPASGAVGPKWGKNGTVAW
jgi:hypothetical protein